MDNLRRQLWQQLSPSENLHSEEPAGLQGAAAAVSEPGPEESPEKGAVEAASSKDNQSRPHQRLVRRAGTQGAKGKRVPVSEGTRNLLRPEPRPDLGTRGREDRYLCRHCGQTFRWPGKFQAHVAGHLEAASVAPRGSWHRRTQSWP